MRKLVVVLLALAALVAPAAAAAQRVPASDVVRADFERTAAADFWEIGASGRRYSRAHVLDVLEHRVPDPAEHTWKTRDFHCRELGPDTYLLTYTLEQGERVSRRSTIWRRNGDEWVIVFHQGTLVGVV